MLQCDNSTRLSYAISKSELPINEVPRATIANEAGTLERIGAATVLQAAALEPNLAFVAAKRLHATGLLRWLAGLVGRQEQERI